LNDGGGGRRRIQLLLTRAFTGETKRPYPQ